MEDLIFLLLLLLLFKNCMSSCCPSLKKDLEKVISKPLLKIEDIFKEEIISPKEFLKKADRAKSLQIQTLPSFPILASICSTISLSKVSNDSTICTAACFVGYECDNYKVAFIEEYVYCALSKTEGRCIDAFLLPLETKRDLLYDLEDIQELRELCLSYGSENGDGESLRGYCQFFCYSLLSSGALLCAPENEQPSKPLSVLDFKKCIQKLTAKSLRC